MTGAGAGGPHFLWGPLLHPPLLAAVLGGLPALRPAWRDGLAAVAGGADGLPLLAACPGARLAGALADLDAAAAARLAFHAAALGRRSAPAAADSATLVWAEPAGDPAAAGWDPSAWAARHGALETAVAEDVMAAFGEVAAEALAARRMALRVRASSRLRAAAAPAPARRRLAARPGDVTILSRSHPYAAFFAVEHYDLTHRRFDGTMSAPIRRAVFLSGDAVTVLPYDPLRDAVLLIEQVRAGPIGRGDPQPWLLEAIAGRIDPGETPEEAARREAREEAGLELGRFLHVADYYPSPGAKAEWITSFVALADLPEGAGGLHGKPEEAEDIRGHRLPWAEAEALMASGEVNNAPLLLTLMWLQRERPRLRG